METKRVCSPALEELLGHTFNLLDHGLIRVIDYMGDDSSIVQMARVSYGAGTKSVSEDRGLIRYLVRNRHTSPLEGCEIKLHVKMPIFVARQWIRHRTASVNEVSGRYSVLPTEFYVPDSDVVKAQSKDNKQGRGDDLLPMHVENFQRLCNANARDFDDYLSVLETGVARELGRINLPLSTYTEWYWKIDLHNLLHFLKLRVDPHAQYEIRVYAETILNEIVAKWVPMVYDAFLEYVLNAKTFSATEMRIIRELSEELRSKAFFDTSLKGRELSEFLAKLES